MQNTSIIKKSVHMIAALVMIFTFIMSFPAASVSAAEYDAPEVSAYAVFADRIALKVSNYSSYPSGSTFEIYVSGKYIKTVKAANSEKINLYDNSRYFKPNTKYTITLKPVIGGTEGKSTSISVKTAKHTYFVICKGTKLYKLSGGKMVYKAKASAKTYFKGALVTANGKEIAGLSAKSYKGEYVRISEGEYKGYYVSAADASRSSDVTAQRYIVSQYGKSMDGGAYVYGAASYRRTDCSGLTMQCYNQIGMNISHSVYHQATLGKAVSRSNMQPGDLIILNNRSHVAMYIGDGKMVHAMNPRDGIQVQSISKLQYYHVDTVRRIIV